MEATMLRSGLTVEPGTYDIDNEWISGAHLRGVDGHVRPVSLTLSVVDAELILKIARWEVNRVSLG